MPHPSADAEELLKLIVPRLNRGDAKDNHFPDRKGEYWALCPFHTDRHATNFSVSVRGFKCQACDAKGGLKALAKELGIELPAPEPDSLTLAEYAAAKRIPVDFLQRIGVSEKMSKAGRPYLMIQYRDEHGKALDSRFRFSMGTRPKSKTGGKNHLYGLWRLETIRKAGWVLIVEGESDCHTAWLNGIPTIGVPGASNWKAEWAEHLAGLDIYVWREPDVGGDTLVANFKRSFQDGKALVAPDGMKDISVAHVQGVDVPALIDELKTTAQPLSEAMPQAMEQAGQLSELSEWVREQLSKNSRRETKLLIAEAIADWLLAHGKLLVDLGQDAQHGGRPYLIADDKALWPLEKESPQTRLALHQAGLNGTEPTFAFVLEHLTMMAIRAGVKSHLSRWQERKADGLYLSCGPTTMVRSSDAGLDLLENGVDDVWFAGDATLPAWSPTDSVDPLSLPAFKPALEAQDEVPIYTPEVQSDLLAAWLAMLVAGIKPLPHLVCLGQRGGGKSILARAILHMLLGQVADLTTLGKDQRDLEAALTRSPLVGLDNVDSIVPDWLPDLIAAAATGTKIDRRQLYTDTTMISRQASATLIITTRTGLFARPDVAERCLPILTGAFEDKDRVADSFLMAQIDERRDGLLSWAARMAWRLLQECTHAPTGLPLRFQDFARAVWAYMATVGRTEDTATILIALRSAQALTIGEADELAQAIITHIDDLGQSVTCSASELVQRLTSAGADISYLGGGKAIARRLREIRGTLALAGIEVTEGKYNLRPQFTIKHQKRLIYDQSVNELHEFNESRVNPQRVINFEKKYAQRSLVDSLNLCNSLTDSETAETPF